MSRIQISTKYGANASGTGVVTATVLTGPDKRRRASVQYDHALGRRSHLAAAQKLAAKLGHAATPEYAGTTNSGGDVYNVAV